MEPQQDSNMALRIRTRCLGGMTAQASIPRFAPRPDHADDAEGSRRSPRGVSDQSPQAFLNRCFLKEAFRAFPPPHQYIAPVAEPIRG
jgi:hypothetical protein